MRVEPHYTTSVSKEVYMIGDRKNKDTEQILINRKKVGKKLAAWREVTDKTQQGMADALGVHVTFISGIERGLSPLPSEYWGKYADAFGIPRSQFYQTMLKSYFSKEVYQALEEGFKNENERVEH